MPLRCGLIGRPQCGKTTVFNAISAANAPLRTEVHRATVTVPDARFRQLVELYKPKKLVPATMDMVDIPGFAEATGTDRERTAALLLQVREADVLVHVVRCFERGEDPVDPIHDIEVVDLELMAADADVLQRKVERLEKRVRSGDKQACQESEVCQRVLVQLHDGRPARQQGLTQSALESVRDCNLLSLKPVLYVANVAEVEAIGGPHVEALAAHGVQGGSETIPVCGRDEAEISELPEQDRAAFLEALGMEALSVERVVHAAYRELGLVDFFTAGEREVHVWTCRQGDKAPVAAGKIHTDMERGFIRLEVIACEDLIGHGSEAAAAEAGKRRLEGKEYEIRDGDVVVVRFSPPRR